MRNFGKESSMKKIWIIGAGRFGMLALNRLADKYDNTSFMLVDSDIKGIELFNSADCKTEESDGVEFLVKNLSPEKSPEWIIPALPVHLAAEWCLQKLADNVKRCELPADIDGQLPNAARGYRQDMYVSHADFLCPDKCSEPAGICTVTGKPRPQNMFELLGELNVPGFTPLVIRSHQLAPGVGGYRPDALFGLLEHTANTENPLIVSTACRCHGVLTAICPQKK